MSTSPPAPWERQPRESPAAWAAFRTYRDLGAERSLDKAYQVRTGRQGSAKRAPGRWDAWSRRWGWVARAAAFDAHVDRLVQAQRERELAGEEAGWQARRRAQREREWHLAEQLAARAEEMLAFPLERTRSSDGTIVEPARWRLVDAARLCETAAKLARLAADMETGRIDLARAARQIAREIAEAEGLDVAEVLREVDRIVRGEEGEA